MDHRPILDSTVRKDLNSGEQGRSPSSPEGWPGTGSDGEQPSSADMRFPGEDGGRSLGEMAQRDLVATLQLLAERAQYITGATGSAIALRDAGQMVCRASAGPSAPEVGAQLQVDSGLSGESVRTKQTLRCDDASTDPRVNRESCEALGIASVVVMPLVQSDEVIGVFELFSDKAHVFDGRDITALERMGAMVFTALEQAVAGLASEPRDHHATATSSGRMAGDLGSHAELRPTASADPGIAFHMHAPVANPAAHQPFENASPLPGAMDSEDVLDTSLVSPPPVTPQNTIEGPVLADSYEQMHQEPPRDPTAIEIENQYPEVELEAEDAGTRPARSEVVKLRKCEGCGFPVSEGRQLCLDCEKKGIRGMEATTRTDPPPYATDVDTLTNHSAIDAPIHPDIPLFLGEGAPEASWLSSHKYMLGAVAVALAGIVALLFAR